MRRGNQRTCLRPSGLQRHDTFAHLCCACGKSGKASRFADRFDEQANGADAIVGNECLDNVFRATARLIADSHQHRDRQAALLQGEVDTDVATLRHDAHAAVHGEAAVFVGPQRDAVERVDVAVTVWSEQLHRACGRHELVLECHVAGFGKA